MLLAINVECIVTWCHEGPPPMLLQFGFKGNFKNTFINPLGKIAAADKTQVTSYLTFIK